MSTRRFAPLLILALAATPLLANAAQTSQQALMAKCSAQNKGKTGEDYKSAQKACLSGKDTSNAAVSPQQRMKDCNAQATGKQLTGAARKSFVSSCLKTH